MPTGVHGRTARTSRCWRRSRLSALAGLACAAFVAPSEGACPPPPPDSDITADYAALLNEILQMGRPRDTGLSLGNQAVWRMRRRSAARYPDTLLSQLRSMKPRLEDMQSYFPEPPGRPVLLVESRLGGFGSTLAFTDCASPGEEAAAEEDERDVELANHVIAGLQPAFGVLPDGLCLVVVFPDRFESDRERRFALAHEMMHTMQNGFYTRGAMEQSWWVEGSAEWFAHKIIDGAAERDHRIEEFFMRQKTCPLTRHSYDAQPFFFWGEQAFTTEWAISVGLGGDEYLSRPEKAAELLAPDQWLEWAVAQADRTITMPDGRPLPAHLEAEQLFVTPACSAVAITGPPLSVQLRKVYTEEFGPTTFKVEAGAAQLAFRVPDGLEWRPATGEDEVDAPTSPMIVAAIMPSGENLNVKLSVGDSDNGTCACHIGAWMERPTPDEEADDALEGALEALDSVRGMVPPDQLDTLREVDEKLRAANVKDEFRFRGTIPDIFDELEGAVETTYTQAGPVVTIRPGGTFVIDDPHTIRGDDTRINYYKYRHYGQWRSEGGVLKLDVVGLEVDGFVSSAPDYEPKRVAFTNEGAGPASYVGGGGDWKVACEAATMTLSPADGRDQDRSEQAVLVRR